MDGIRTRKVVDGVVHTYVTQNGKVVRETIGMGTTAKVLDFIYDHNGQPFALRYSTNGGSTFTTYYYVLNLQGDVIKLVTATGSPAATYRYNAWGKLYSQSGTMATINPLRYRGYYYDTETGFYYLRSRYYDPTNYRFINADSYASTGQGFLGYNMFAYCNNNPIIYTDDTGISGTLAMWMSSMWWLCGVDAVLPIGDIIYAAGVVVTGVVDIVNTIGADNVARLATDGVNAAKQVTEGPGGNSSPQPPDDRFRSYTSRNFRYNLQQLTGETGDGKQAHHVLPQKFIEQFEKADIKIHDPKYGSWVDSPTHSKFSTAYNNEWLEFFKKTVCRLKNKLRRLLVD